MLHNQLSLLYEIPSYIYFLIIAFCIIVWGVAGSFFDKKKVWLILNSVIMLVTIVAVFFITLFSREVQQSQIVLSPFSVFSLAKTYPDVYNQMVLNIVLFLPFGLSLPFCVKSKIKRPVMFVMSVSVALSMVVEILQYVFERGYSEVDDVLLNVLGALLGTLSYLFAQLINNRLQKRKK